MNTKWNLTIALFMAAVYVMFMTSGVLAAEEHAHDHSEFEYLYGNHYCPPCKYADLVDPHFYADISNKKAGVYARVYVCSSGCADKIKENVGKYYKEVYRIDRKTGKDKPALDLKNQNCPSSGDPVDGKTSIEYNGMIVHFCCADCVESFVKDPEPGMRKLLPEAKEFKFEGASKQGEHADDHDHGGEKDAEK